MAIYKSSMASRLRANKKMRQRHVSHRPFVNFFRLSVPSLKINPPGSPTKRCKEAHRIKSRLKESANLMSPGYFVSTWFPFVSTRTFLFLLFVCCLLVWPHFKTTTWCTGFEPQYLDVYTQTVGGLASGPPKG